MPRGLVAMARSGGHCPLRVSGGILCSERGQSRDAFQAIRLEETSPRCNNLFYSILFNSEHTVDKPSDKISSCATCHCLPWFPVRRKSLFVTPFLTCVTLRSPISRPYIQYTNDRQRTRSENTKNMCAKCIRVS